MLTDEQRRFLDAERVAHLATADAAGHPHVVPICYALVGGTVYFTVDEKPKRRPLQLKRLANLRENPFAAVIVDRYGEDWSQLGWVMVRGRADVLDSGPEHDMAQIRLCARYPQLAGMQIAQLPVVAIRIEYVSSWGRVSGE